MADDSPLGPLEDGPVPPLAPAADVRARGDQRKRRERALLAGSGVLLAVALVGGTVLVTGGSDDDSESIAPLATSSTSQTPTVAPTGPPTSTPTASAPATAPATEEPDGGQTTDPGCGPAGCDDPYIVAEAIPTAADLPGDVNWVRSASSRNPSAEQVAVDPCGTDAKTPGTGRTAFLSGSYTVQDESGEMVPESGGVYDAVSRFESPEQAQAAYAAITARVGQCPTRTGDSLRAETKVVTTSPFVAEEFSGAADEASLYPFPVYYGAAVVDDLVAVWQYNPGEGTNRPAAAQIAGLVRAGLCADTGSC